MTESAWHFPHHGPGRLYQQGRDPYVKYEQWDPLVQRIADELKTFVQLESSVRLLLDGPYINPTTTVITVPFEGESDTIYHNLATLIFQQLWGYYLSADPKTTHFGLSNLVFDGSTTNLVRRELEKFLNMVVHRDDIAGRVMQNYRMACDMPAFNRDVYMKDVTSKYLDIHLGVRMYTYGEAVNRITTFLPIVPGAEAIDRIYYNIEHIIHQNLVSYDENHDHYLPVTEELILRELEAALQRARRKGNTRKKIINGLKFHTVLMDDPSMINHISLADLYYDKINRIDLLEEASQRSRDLFASALIRSTEMTTAAVNIEDLQMEERVYIERPEQEATTVQARPGSPPAAESEAAPAPAAARPAEEPQEEEETSVPLTVHKDDLSEL